MSTRTLFQSILLDRLFYEAKPTALTPALGCPLSLSTVRPLIEHQEHPLLRPCNILRVKHARVQAPPKGLSYLGTCSPVERAQEIENRDDKMPVCGPFMGHQLKRGLDKHGPSVPLLGTI